jgi:hypothetical protein
MEWQPIETAPKDGTPVILLPYGEVEDLFVSFWMESDDRWANNEWSKITHWAHLPPPPTTTAQEET